MDLIEKLKHNEKPFGLNSPEEQECFEKVGKRNCEEYSGREWGRVMSVFFNSHTYRIKPDYQPEPQVEKAEIELGDIWTGDGSVKDIVREEVIKAIRTEIKTQLKAKQGRLETMAAEVFDQAVKLKPEQGDTK